MDKKEKVTTVYGIFGSELRGTVAVEKQIDAVLMEKETPENMKILSRELNKEWTQANENVASLRLSFSKFEEKLEMKKAEISRIYAQDKEKKKSPCKANSSVKIQ